MSGNRSNKNSDPNFDTYRQIAPETLDDQSLHNIIKNNANNYDAIMTAIENLWHDLPDQKAVGSDWVTTSKPRKMEAPIGKSAQSSARRGGDSGSGVRGRNTVTSGGKGSGARDKDGQSLQQRSSALRPTAKASVAAARLSVVDAESSQPVLTEIKATIISTEYSELATVEVTAATTPSVVWKGISLAEKLKRAEAEKLKAEQEAKKEIPSSSAANNTSNATPVDASTDSRKSSSRSRGGSRRPRGGSNTATTTAGTSKQRSAEESCGNVEINVAEQTVEVEEKSTEVEVTDVVVSTTEQSTEPEEVVIENVVETEIISTISSQLPPLLVQQPTSMVETLPIVVVAAAASNVDNSISSTDSAEGFLKLGKWEAPAESGDIGAFQFGSFGSTFTDAVETVSSSSAVPAAIITTTSVPNNHAAWVGGLQSAASDSNNSNVSSTNTVVAEQQSTAATNAASVWSPTTSSSSNLDHMSTTASAASASNSSATASSISSLFQQTNNINKPTSSITATMPALEPISSATVTTPALTRAPPGLESNNNPAKTTSLNNNSGSNNTSRTNTSAPGQQMRSKIDTSSNTNIAATAQQQPVQHQQPMPYVPQYGTLLPPGIPGIIPGRANIGGPNPLTNLPPYAAYPVAPFDLTQQFGYAGNTVATGTAAANIPSSSMAAPSAASTLSTGTSVAGSQQQPTTSAVSGAASTPSSNLAQQQQQYAPAAPFQYYPNPFYTNQGFYYGQPQVPNYYAPAPRGVYQQQRVPYGTDPYGNSGSGLYPADVYQQQAVAGQFPDSSGSYGNGIPLHQPMNPATVNSTNVANGNAVGANTGNSKNAAKGNNTTNTSANIPQQQGLMPQDHGLHLNSNYYANPYTARGPLDAQAWQQYSQQTQAGGWGAPMMFSNAPTAANGTGVAVNGLSNQQFSAQQPPLQAQTQQNNNNNRSSSNNNVYNNSASFGGRSGTNAASGVNTQQQQQGGGGGW